MKLILAPMEGLTDPIMRDVLTSVGSFDWCVTEFIRVTNSVLPDHIYHQYCPELLNGGKTAAGTPVHVQFLGNDPEMLAANAIRAVKLGAPAIDMNFGCPAKTVNRHRGGSVLLDEPEVVHELVKAVRDVVPAHIPVSAKMRLGYMDRHFMLDNAHAIEDAGAAWVTVHARTKADGYTPPAFWDQLRPIREALKINVIANGEIWNNADAKQCRLESGCEDLMIGRGAVTTPDLTQCIRQNIDTPLLTWNELLTLQIRFLNGGYKKEMNMVGRYKQWLGMMSKHYPEAKALWDEVKRIKPLDDIILKLNASAT
ncbi:tRNA-dihydrouridine synthase [Acinetobacter johnsonii]|uniref:tRNA-dihydrouridine(16) synthase n=1 Tax=Acinetobacter johnsonii TaxID=40214 RepID=A0AA43BNK2_ACIJO|nr:MULTISPECIES: tRNA-dihydrouridine synthase [Acinetobacter]MDN5541662.1 tRNA-dihydrouridine synthase [Acinetobacter sp.]MBL8285650.1 tRNA-dihydrouridine synthase [Acinetobacter johnsonii]MDH1519350.1 tRNA-dihydrouridine synthase [Acinetobacter johnsonii]MDH2173649.1 tRNA-dihydrouridine synthase [Acinetobacter johnsonii]MDH2176845.1 tRNA-dihydrouridine synthase [Acinetobacter johnsonii]